MSATPVPIKRILTRQACVKTTSVMGCCAICGQPIEGQVHIYTRVLGKQELRCAACCNCETMAATSGARP